MNFYAFHTLLLFILNIKYQSIHMLDVVWILHMLQTILRLPYGF